MHEHIVYEHVLLTVTPPKPEELEIVPYTLIEVRAMVAVVGRNDQGDVIDISYNLTSA